MFRFVPVFPFNLIKFNPLIDSIQKAKNRNRIKSKKVIIQVGIRWIDGCNYVTLNSLSQMGRGSECQSS